MLEAAETGQTVDQEIFKKLEPELRTQLVHLQLELEKGSFPVIVIVSGDDPVGARDILNLMSEWLDPRFVLTSVFAKPTEDERLHPMAWRYWQQLPPAGRIAVYMDEWTTHSVALRLEGEVGRREFLERLEEIERYERMLAVDGAVFLKFYLHQPADALAQKSKKIKAQANWSDVARIGRHMMKRPRHTRTVIEQVLQQTGTGLSPWRLIESTCPYYRKVAVAQLILETVNARLLKVKEQPGKPAHEQGSSMAPPEVGRRSVLDSVDLSSRISDDDYDREMSALRKQLQRLTQRAHDRGISTVAAFEGWDASGKGGTIRRLAQSMNPEMYRIIPIAAPDDEERAHHYLWRFWRHIPRDGGFVIFDRTWYGRVLVERVEGFATESQWQRAYDEINYFERQLVRHGIIVLKFWLHIDKEEQLRRFKAREEIAFKQYKISPDDYRNREKWDAYVQGVDDMVARTSTPDAPWHLIPSNDKGLARVQVLRDVVGALKERL